MNERTLCQMEVHPEIIRWHRERLELFKRWQEIYDPNPFANCQQPMAGLSQSLCSALMGNAGIGASKVDWP